jgi:hypothetical protein
MLKAANLNQRLQDFTQLAATLAESAESLVLVGGVPRSGTTSVAMLLHSLEDIFCFDECPLLKNDQLLSINNQIRDLLRAERSLWQDSENKSYRGFTEADDFARRKFFFFSALTTFLTDYCLSGKSISKIRVAACKTPSLEMHFPAIAKSLEPLKVHYIHCVRAPFEVMQSNWQMPWILETDKSRFVNSMMGYLHESMLAYHKICESNTSCEVIRNEEVRNDAFLVARKVAAMLGIEAPLLLNSKFAFDDWPAERRRGMPKLDELELLKVLSQDARFVEWCSAFGYDSQGRYKPSPLRIYNGNDETNEDEVRRSMHSEQQSDSHSRAA